ncbi:hypothetical protein I545_2984 [Mycobacterium kansasii 662]|uniref:Uncharacterized protein n=2 Tax=Mycobacterium kansasii TaxID=1768 RepID=A0A1V3WMI2_MYCKA|nr:hypothetical protein I547_7550 [Mycobacterium kansasii 824]EUA18657.1 hypothetical protein I545_2984 [Mycobacterium kansasii 662]OOK68193.1 hypothetical protein BZL29_6547 [Mycobacterium kansasii]
MTMNRVPDVSILKRIALLSFLGLCATGRGANSGQRLACGRRK